jgi:integrase
VRYPVPKLSSRQDLTDAKVAAFKRGLKRVEYPDTQVPGLRVIVQPSGLKVWAVRTRKSGKFEKITLGAVAKYNVEQARDKAREAIKQRSQKAGSDAAPDAPANGASAAALADDASTAIAAQPVALDVGAALAVLQARFPQLGTAIAALIPADAPPTAPESEPEPETAEPTFGECWTAYLADPETLKLRTLARRKKWADKHILPVWRDRAIKTITQQGDVRPIIKAAAERGVAACNESIAFLSAFFNWCALANHAYIATDASPAKGFQKSEPNNRKRALTDAEIKTFWNGCTAYAGDADFGRVFGPYCKMLLLTGARRTEVSAMEYAEIDFAERLWTIPGERTKNGLPLAVYLTDLMLAVLNSVPKVKGSPFVFTTDGDAPISGFSKGKTELDALTPIAVDWTLHDLRRTFVSGCNSLRVIKGEVVEKCVNHISGKLAGVAGIYNVYAYLPEKTEAWKLWSNRVASLARGRRDNR